MNLRQAEQTPPFVFAVIGLSVSAVFAVDCVTPLGWAEWVFYLAPVALCQLAAQPNAALITALVCSLLLLLGYVTSPTSALDQIAMYNRSFALVVIWCVAFLTRQVVASRRIMHRRDWLSTAQARLSEVVQGEKRVDELGQAVVDFLAGYVDAQIGALYAHDGAQSLRRVGGYALEVDGLEGRTFRIGDGLVGQVAASRRVTRVQDVPGGYARVRSGVGAHEPRELLLAPVTADRGLQGVLELGFFHATGDGERELLELLAEPIGVALRTAEYRSRLQTLLEETQAQAEELEAQGEELRTNNEELEQQSDVLREQQANLEQQQAELEQTNVQLEEHAQLLVEQKAELMASREELARKAAELDAASRYKSEFLANMSHELRTPLNSSLILAKLLSDNRDGNLTHEQVKYAQSIYSAGNDLLDLINDVLDLSKIEAGMMEVKPELVRLARLAENLNQMFQPLSREKGLAFAIVLEPSAPSTLTTDAQRLKQILKNLLSNALKFTERGRVSLTVSSAAPGRVTFAVSDTGIGIPASQHQLIFEAFRQAEGGANRKFGGTGLGLSISRDLARLLGGDIALSSEPGLGSTFTLELPENSQAEHTVTRPVVVEAPAPPNSSPPPPSEALVSPFDFEDDRESLEGSSRVLLVVEDDPTFAKLLVDLGRSVGFKVLLTASADEAVRLAIKHRPAAILLDVGLPDHSGLTVLDRLKSAASTRHIPVQVVSATDSMQAALEMGAVGYMLKPVEREQLLAALQNLEHKSSQRMRSVLVVEDDATQRESICKLLETSDVRTVAVASAREALEQLAKTTHDCVVLDLTLSDGSGYDLLERMAEDDAYSFPPVIIYTGRSLSSDEEQRLRRYSRSIIIKGARSPERLLDEVTLFLHQVEEKLPPDRQRMLAEARSREKAFDGRRVLLVEDDVRNVFALSSVLEQRGAKLRIARNGREALEALEQEPDVDIVLMDIMMPEMDGFEAMRAIRENPAFGRLPIIALTAKAMRDDHENCLRAGANDYIAKPIEVEKLLSLMRVWMLR